MIVRFLARNTSTTSLLPVLLQNVYTRMDVFEFGRLIQFDFTSPTSKRGKTKGRARTEINMCLLMFLVSFNDYCRFLSRIFNRFPDHFNFNECMF